MRLINVKAFLEREELIEGGRKVDRRMKVLEFRDDEATNYAILSHRWIGPEVDYAEMVGLAKMDREERDDIRGCDGYRKLLASCKLANRDGFEWLWMDTCCIDKTSSAELSEAINSMYRWYENSRVCYAYLHDVSGSSLPTASDDGVYPNSNGWPEWFSRGWTLQEMIAPGNVQFFNKDWQRIGDKRTLAATLATITRVPQIVLTDGLSSNRPCVAQILSWAADRTTTRVEDRAYSLLGLLDVNMPMLYGEGKKAFQRLQLEIIRMSDDQSIFAWGWDGKNGRTGGILADDPIFFRSCHEMELMDHDDFVQELGRDLTPKERRSIKEGRVGVFPITNRGIQIWLLLASLEGSCSVFQARLPCRTRPSHPPVSINLALWKSNYYRYFIPLRDAGRFYTDGTLRFRRLYLRYQDTPHDDTTFKVDDSPIIKNGFTCHGAYPSTVARNPFTLSNVETLGVKVYFDSQTHRRCAVGFGQFFGQYWVKFVCEKSHNEDSWEDYAKNEYKVMLARAPEHAHSMAKACSGGERYGRVCISQARLLRSNRVVQTACVVWESSRSCGVRFEVYKHPSSSKLSDEWTGFDVHVSRFLLCTSVILVLTLSRPENRRPQL